MIPDPGATQCLFECERSCGEGHRCAKLCHEVCSPCEFRERKVLKCGHENEVGTFTNKQVPFN